MTEKDRIYKGTGDKKLSDLKIEDAPSWRFKTKETIKYKPTKKVIDAVNTAIYLRRPLLIKGKAGFGKSSLSYSIAEDLDIKLLPWRITSKSTLEEGLYSYDAIARLHDASRGDEKDINQYLKLGALGSAFAYLSDEKEENRKKSVLLIDEIDKSDIDLPNDLLHILEEHEFEIEELKRLEGKQYINHYRSEEKVEIENGKVKAYDVPIVIMTSNDTREFPSAFLRRCIQIDIDTPTETELLDIVKEHFGDEIDKLEEALVKEYKGKLDNNQHLSIDQLLSAIYLLRNNLLNIEDENDIEKEEILKYVLQSLE